MRVVAVCWGGPGLEHEVSAVSGKQVLAALDPERYVALPVHIRRDGLWEIEGEALHPLDAAAYMRAVGCEVVFPALHGPFGEDGTLQGFLESAGIPYVGAGVRGSALACDKIRAKRLAAAQGFAVAPDVVVGVDELEDAADALGYPLFVKHPREGSSLGMAYVSDAAELRAVGERLRPLTSTLLVEKPVEGREITAGVLADERGRPRALPLVLIEPQHSYFDFESKYTKGASDKVVPAPLGTALTELIQEAALSIHALLGLGPMSRSDFILTDKSDFIFLEVNTIPGLTPTSLLPTAAAAAGLSFREMLTRLIELGATGSGGGEWTPWSASFRRSGARSTGSSTATTAARNSS